MRIIVSRLPANKQSPEPIIEPLATQQNVGVELGKAFIYDSMNNNEYSIRMPYRGEIYPAQEVSVHDESIGESFVAIVIGHDISIQKPENSSVKIVSVLNVRRLLPDE